ncbi:hypothetical protein Tco_1309111 [Tanacetum coccineum]
MELDLEARLMGKTLIINRSQDPDFGDFLKLNDLNEPLELKQNQVEDLGPTIEEGEVTNAPIEEIVKTRNDNDEITNGIEDYPSFCDHDRKIHVIVKDKLEYKGKNVVGAFMNVPIFVGTFSVVTDFTVLEDMDAYRDKEMDDVIVGKEFCKDIKVSAQDKLQGILHLYQKLKRLYKGVLNLGMEYIKDDKVKEWLTRGHMSVYEMEWLLHTAYPGLRIRRPSRNLMNDLVVEYL